MSLPSHQKAIKTDGEQKASIHADVPIPEIPEGYILVKTSYVGLNPTDWKHIENVDPGFTVGCDFAGTVVSVNSGVTKPLSKGDRVAGFVHGCKSNNKESGAFAEYLVAKGDLVIKLSDNVSDAEAAAYGVALLTVGQGMYQTLEMPWPDQPSKDKLPILIYGGSTGTGLFAITLAKLSGLKVIVTCSPRNFDYVKKLGADAAFDYKDENCAKNIRDYTNNSLMHALDCIGENGSAVICANALSSASGVKYSALLEAGVEEFPREDAAINTFTLGYTAGGKAFSFFAPFALYGGHDIPALPDHFD